MPVRTDYYFRTGVTSSYPACLAFKAAQLQSEGLAARYLRLMMEAFGLECRLATDGELIRLAEEVGLNRRHVEKDLHSGAVAKALCGDVDVIDPIRVNIVFLLGGHRDRRYV